MSSMWTPSSHFFCSFLRSSGHPLPLHSSCRSNGSRPRADPARPLSRSLAERTFYTDTFHLSAGTHPAFLENLPCSGPPSMCHQKRSAPSPWWAAVVPSQGKAMSASSSPVLLTVFNWKLPRRPAVDSATILPPTPPHQHARSPKSKSKRHLLYASGKMLPQSWRPTLVAPAARRRRFYLWHSTSSSATPQKIKSLLTPSARVLKPPASAAGSRRETSFPAPPTVK